MPKPKVPNPDDILGLGYIIRPSGTCFDDVLDFITTHTRPEHYPLYRIVHGICLIPTTDERFAHAWVERTLPGNHVTIIQGGIIDGYKVFFGVQPELFNERLRPQRCTRYTIPEAKHQNEISNHFGPWDPEYDALARDRTSTSRR